MNDTIQQGLKGKLDKFSNLPSIPQIIVKIKQVAENPKATAADLANCILSDHQLTSRILRMANSAYYGSFSGKITTVTHGIVVMGFRAVHNIAISMALYDVVNSITKGSKFNLTAFWIRSLANGVIAKYLAQQINHTKLIEAAFIAGFMHDIGQVILAGAFPDKYEQISKLGTETPDIYTAERAILGIDHMEAGMLLARKWNLPSTLIRPILKHHRINKARKEKSKDILVDLVFIGDILYPYVMGGQHPQSTAYTAVVEQTKILINISDDCITELVASCHQQVAEIAQDLE
ncbi:MAG: HDOD domain-containing protein, partial [candidate division Zixibacteria bacterium]|nr:HDOD domain-containing protein [candidate division Zixibacteria bacterium]